MAAKPKFSEKMADRLPDMFRNGESVSEVCVELGISRKTYYKWCKQHKTWRDAAEMGSTIAESWWSKLGQGAAAGRVPGFQGSAWVFTMKNRFGWSDKQETQVSGQMDVTQHVSVSFRD